MTHNGQRVYYLIALFNIAAVSVGLYLTHRVTTMFERSIAGNTAATRRADMYLRLDRLASDIDAPGNDVFDDADVGRQERRLDAAAGAFNQALAATRATVAAGNDPIRETMLADLAAAQAASVRMVADGRVVFQQMRRRQSTLASQSMAAMDRNYARLTDVLAKLRRDAIASELTLLDDDRWAAHTLRWYQAILGAAILLVTGASGVYGQKSSRRAQAHLAELESYITRLRQSEATLEQRVLERTEALRAAEERLRLAARATNDALWDWEIPTDRIWCNTAFADLFGHIYADSAIELRTRLVHPDDFDRVSKSMQQFLEGSTDVWIAEYRFRRSNGATYAWVLDRGYVLRDAEGKPRRMIGSMMDITDRKEAERMKSDFVSFVSHQLRTPLAGMNWMLELAGDSEGLPDTARGYVQEARESAARLVTLVNDLLDIARLESGRTMATPEAVCLRDVTRSVLHEMHTLIAERGHAVDIEEQPTAAAWADAQLVRQVIANLLSNAVKYTPHRGRIAVSLQQHNGTLQWSVADSGVGIPRAAQARLFERFYRAENVVAMEVEGTGLGLHLVRLIVEQAGGRVWCESEEGQGAVFSFTLPIAPQAEVAI
ncbi:MAG: hypothetical protein DMF84_25530 [Acidobacteria bacterium]|nr:MAG: hypothetical protein DMF84_25530 [Acidobacteriota bacterium]